jgi:hypothetical protein
MAGFRRSGHRANGGVGDRTLRRGSELDECQPSGKPFHASGHLCIIGRRVGATGTATAPMTADTIVNV